MGFLEKYFSEKTIKSFGLTTEQILVIEKKLKEAEEERLEEEREALLICLYSFGVEAPRDKNLIVFRNKTYVSLSCILRCAFLSLSVPPTRHGAKMRRAVLLIFFI